MSSHILFMFTSKGTQDDQYIFLSELLSKIRRELTAVTKPNRARVRRELAPATKPGLTQGIASHGGGAVRFLSTDNLPSVPDVDMFEPPTGSNCAGNDKAISVDITVPSGEGSLEITICTFLAFELEGKLDARGLLDSIDDHVNLKLEAYYLLHGALSTGVKITFTSLTELPVFDSDPIKTQLYAESDVTGALGLGLIEATMSGGAVLEGSLGLSYCPTCDGFLEDYYRTGEESSFYYQKLFGYEITGALALSAGGVKGVQLGSGAIVRIKDDNGGSSSLYAQHFNRLMFTSLIYLQSHLLQFLTTPHQLWNFLTLALYSIQ